MVRYLEFYDRDGLAWCGSDAVLVFDQRLANRTALKQAYDRVQSQANGFFKDPANRIPPRACYCKVVQSPRLGSEHVTVLVELHSLENPVYLTQE